MKQTLDSGVNIAIKIPKTNYDKAVAFYRDVLKLEIEEQPVVGTAISRTHRVKFGCNTLWLDCVADHAHDETGLAFNVSTV